MTTEPHSTAHPAPAPTDRPSKSRQKRDAEALQELALELRRLSVDRLLLVGLPDVLTEAVQAAQTMKPDAALKRQTKYIGKLLRQCDAELIRVKLAEIAQRSRSAARSLHFLENWRDRLVMEGDTALGDLMADFPQADRPKLRQLIAAARTETERDHPPKAARLIFKYLRSLLNEAK